MSRRRRATAVIPTQFVRPRLLQRAVASVRSQVGVAMDVVVVPNNVAPGALAPDFGSGVRVVPLAGPGSAASARNFGASVASTEWIAFLDDDDEWLPHKVMRQLEVAQDIGAPAIVGTRYNVFIDGEFIGVRPPHVPRSGQDLSEWLLCSRWPLSTGAHAAASSLVTSVRLLERCGFRELKVFEDHDWILRATRHHGAHFVQMDAPLTNYFLSHGGNHASTAGSWRDLEHWVDDNPDLVTQRSAAAALLLCSIRQTDARADYRRIVRSAFKRGRPHPLDLIASAAVVHPALQQWRRSIGARLRRRRSAGPPRTAANRAV